MFKPHAIIAEYLAELLAAGGFVLGQVQVMPGPVLRHVDDTGVLEIATRPEDAREIAKYDGEGNYRPLKTAPNLRRGWELRLESLDDLRRALDFFYPAALGTWFAFRRNELVPLHLRETLGRQTGRYRVTNLVTDEQAGEAIRNRCNSRTGCLRRQLWRISPEVQSPFTEDPSEIKFDGALPILCVEACNLLVADIRPIAKQNVQNPSRRADGDSLEREGVS